MNIGGLLAPSRLPRRSVAIATVALLVAAFMVLGTRPAQAATLCQVTNGVLTLTIADNDTVTISLNPIGRIELASENNPDGAIVCPLATPRVTNISEIIVDATSAGTVSQTLIIDMTNGFFQPEFAATTGTEADEILFDVRLGQQPAVGSGDELVLIGRPAAAGADEITAGANGINLNGDGDLDVIFDDPSGASADAPSHEDLVIESAGGNDFLSAGGGNGTVGVHEVPTEFIMGAGNHTITGGTAGTDRVNYSGASGALTIDLEAGTASVASDPATSDTVSDVERVTGTALDDVIFGNDADNRFDAGDGDDVLVGRLGGDDMRGNGGVDTLDYSGQSAPSPEADCPTGVVVTLGSTTSDSFSGTGECGDAEGDNPRGSSEHIIGSPFDDILGGNQSDNKIDAGAGSDEIAGSSGNDHLIGGEGNSVIDGGSGNDLVEGGAGSDELLGGSGNDLVKPGGGTDDVAGDDAGGNSLGSSDTIDFSTAAGPVLIDLSRTDFYETGEGLKRIREFENIIGSPADDTLFGDGAGNVIAGGLGDDVIDGADGSDTADYSGAPSSVSVDLAAAAPQTSGGHGNDTLADVETIAGSDFNDVLRGSAADNTLLGGAGNDTIEGRGGDDDLDGGDGIDTLEYRSSPAGVVVNLSSATLGEDDGWGGTDSITGFENLVGSDFIDDLTGTGGDNVIEGLDDDDEIDGGGHGEMGDTASYRSAPSAVAVDLLKEADHATGGAGTDTLANIENVTGSAHNDAFRGTTTANIFKGLGGFDVVTYSEREAGVALAANGKTDSGEEGEGDTIATDVEGLVGGEGNDLLSGASGVDNVLVGGAGSDTADYRSNPNGVTADLAANRVTGASIDILDSIENVFGSNHADTLLGDGAANELRGEGGDDVIRGVGGNDILRGGTGNDIFGEGSTPNGADVINGDLGLDTVDYSDRTGTINATFEGTANDGAPGEDDNLISIERVLRPDGGGGTTGPLGFGYWLVASDGGIFSFGDSGFFGSTGDLSLNQPIVGMTPTPTGDGYWFVASDGGIFAFGDAGFFGSMGGTPLNQPIVGMESTPTGNGYWLVAADGGIFSFGDAVFQGSTGDITLNQPIVGMTSTPSGQGYWFVASDGGIFSFGDATFAGSMGGTPLNQPIVGMEASNSGDGYWLVASDGGIFSFGDATFRGSTGDIVLNEPIVGMTRTSSGAGYWFVAADGGIFSFGDASFAGSMGSTPLNQPIVGMAALP